MRRHWVAALPLLLATDCSSDDVTGRPAPSPTESTILYNPSMPSPLPTTLNEPPVQPSLVDEALEEQRRLADTIARLRSLEPLDPVL